jgi:hypothetical protein
VISIVTLLREDLEKELRGVLPKPAVRTFILFLEQVQQLELEMQAQRKLLMATAKVVTAVTKSDEILKRFEEATARNERNANIGVEAIKQGDEDGGA